MQKNPGNYNGLYSIIVNLLADGRFNEAVPYIENLQKNKDDYQAIVYLGDVALGQCDREKAIQLWNQAVEKSPNTWQAYFARADRLKKLGMFEAAMEDYEAAINDYRRIIQCIAEDHNPEENAESERLEGEIKRLCKLAERMKLCIPYL